MDNQSSSNEHARDTNQDANQDANHVVNKDATDVVNRDALQAGAQDAAKATSFATPSVQSQPARNLASWGMFVALASLVLSIIIAWWGIDHAKRFERTAAAKLIAVETENRDLKALAKTTSDQMREVTARQAIGEAKLADALNQQGALERQYQELSRSRGDAQLIEVESSLSAAVQQIQLSGNIRGALIALQDADARLERMNQPPLLGVRRQIAKDIDRLRQVQVADPVLLTSKIDNVIEALPKLRLLAEPNPKTAGEAAIETKSNRAFLDRMTRVGSDGWSALKSEFLQLFRVQKIDAPDALLLSPEQSFFVRENFKLRLNTLRLAVLSRNEKAARADAAAANTMILQYFDTKQSQVIAAQNELKEISQAPIAVELPSLTEAQAQVRALRSRDGKN